MAKPKLMLTRDSVVIESRLHKLPVPSPFRGELRDGAVAIEEQDGYTVISGDGVSKVKSLDNIKAKTLIVLRKDRAELIAHL
jgi:hypothetical protein